MTENELDAMEKRWRTLIAEVRRVVARAEAAVAGPETLAELAKEKP